MAYRKVYRKYISQHGEIFEGSLSELMKAKGIKHKIGLTRPAGAPDAEGVRWLRWEVYEANGEAFVRKPLYLGNIKRYDRDWKTGKMTEFFEGPSNLASIYCLCKEYLERPEDEQVSEITAQCEELIVNTEAKYVVIDNDISNNPYALRAKKIEKDMKNVWKWQTKHPNKLNEYKELRRKAERLEDEKFRDAFRKKEALDIVNAEGHTPQTLLKIAAAHGKLAEYKAGEWTPPV